MEFVFKNLDIAMVIMIVLITTTVTNTRTNVKFMLTPVKKFNVVLIKSV